MNKAWGLVFCFLSLVISVKSFGAPQDDFVAGKKAYQSGDVVAAMPSLKRAADAGHAEAQSLYGYILDLSEENEAAAKYYRLAADQGNADGQYGLGVLYAAGEGLPKDPVAARRWFERAGTQGHVRAIDTLSQAFLGGSLGFKRDPGDAEGLGWVRKAADQGSLGALDYLAKGYRSGELGTVDLAQAERYEARIKQLSPEQKKAKGKR